MLTTTAALAGVRAFWTAGRARPKVITLDTVSDLLADEWEPEPIGIGELAYLQYTSGSTRAPAGVEITTPTSIANAAQLWEAVPGHTACLGRRPCGCRSSTTWGWSRRSRADGGGNQAVFMDPVAFVMHPVRWLRLLSEYGDVFTGGPNFAYEYTAARVAGGEGRAGPVRNAVMLERREPIGPALDASTRRSACAGCARRRTPRRTGWPRPRSSSPHRARGRPPGCPFDRRAAAGRAVPVPARAGAGTGR